jgi:hypothetical protein
MKNIDITKQGGSDGINNRMLRLIAESIDYPLFKLFQKIAQQGEYPNCWSGS